MGWACIVHIVWARNCRGPNGKVQRSRSVLTEVGGCLCTTRRGAWWVQGIKVKGTYDSAAQVPLSHSTITPTSPGRATYQSFAVLQRGVDGVDTQLLSGVVRAALGAAGDGALHGLPLHSCQCLPRLAAALCLPRLHAPHVGNQTASLTSLLTSPGVCYSRAPTLCGQLCHRLHEASRHQDKGWVPGCRGGSR